MKKTILFLMVIFFTSGCSTVKTVNKNYGKVQYINGVNEKEAKYIAKKCLLESPYSSKYRMRFPEFLDNGDTYPFPNYWFVSFREKGKLFEPSHFLVVIDRRDGKIVYSEQKHPTYVRGLRWIFYLDPKEYPWHSPEIYISKL